MHNEVFLGLVIRDLWDVREAGCTN